MSTAALRRYSAAVLLLAISACTASTSGKAPSSASAPTSTSTSGSAPTSASVSTPAPSSAGDARLSGAPALATAVTAAASRDVADVNTYDYRHLAAAYRRARTDVTGSFAADYRRAFVGVVEPSARRLQATQTATVKAVGFQVLHTSDATVLVFGSLTRQSTTVHQRVDPFAAEVILHRVGTRWLIAQLSTGLDDPGPPAGTPALATAYRAADSAVVAITTLSRAGFAQDFARALATTTGALRAELSGHRAGELAALRTGHFDLRGQLAGAAVVSASGTAVRVLAAVRSVRVPDSGSPPAPATQRLEVTMVYTGGRWLAADLLSIT